MNHFLLKSSNEVETFAAICGIIIIIAFFGNIFYFFFSILLEQIRNVRDEIILSYSDKFRSSLKKEYDEYFKGRFAFYDKLSDHQQVKFRIRVRRFIRQKKFKGRADLEVTSEMKMMIAASAVQLTFGLENYLLDHFSDILIYPESYLSPVTGKYHLGEANPKGVLVISWKDFLKGYAIPDDTFNVGLHEMAHALELEERLGGRFDAFFSEYYPKWKQISEDEYENVRDEGNSFFRSYAGTNRHEFFAVCVESFFEASHEFRNQLPEIYFHLCVLLNQDPLNNETLVSKKSYKSADEMVSEIQTQKELFITEHWHIEWFFSPLLVLLILCMISISKNKVEPGLVFAGIVLSALFSIPALLKGNKISLYEKYLGIKNGSGKLKALYPLEEITSVSFLSSRRGTAIQIIIVRDGKIFKNAYPYSAKGESIIQLKNLLKEKNVIVKTE